MGKTAVLRHTNTAIESSLPFSRKHLDECLADHKCGRSEVSSLFPAAGNSFPKRLIDVLAFQNADHDVKLVDVTGKWKYAALSYCWGLEKLIPATQLKDNKCEEYMRFLDRRQLTIRSLLKDRMTRISYQKLPMTIRDAIDVTRALGIRYLWVDSLCIIQKDDKDFEEEAPKMGSLYHHATVTIAADRGLDMDSGLFNDQDEYPLRCRGPALELENRDMSGSGVCFQQYSEDAEIPDSRKLPANYYPFLQKELSSVSQILQSSLESRAWCFQEQFLSSRILHYTPSKVVWKCDESFIMNDPYAYTPYDISSRSILLDLDLKKGLVENWYTDIVKNYCGRRLTRETDRLPAISSVAKLFNSRLGSKYIAGLFETEIVRGLLWAIKKPSSNGSHKSNIAPSFSWASRAEFSLAWLSPPSYFQGFKLYHSKVTHCSDDEYGAIQEASISLFGLSVKVTLDVSLSKDELYNDHGITKENLYIKHGMSWNGFNPNGLIRNRSDHQSEGSAWLDDRESTSQDITFLKLYSEAPEGPHRGPFVGLLLVPDQCHEDTYRRIGVAELVEEFDHKGFEEKLFKVM
jgi:hypothetical protein